MVSVSVLEGTGMLATERLEWLHSPLEAVLSGEKRATSLAPFERWSLSHWWALWYERLRPNSGHHSVS